MRIVSGLDCLVALSLVLVFSYGVILPAQSGDSRKFWHYSGDVSCTVVAASGTDFSRESMAIVAHGWVESTGRARLSIYVDGQRLEQELEIGMGSRNMYPIQIELRRGVSGKSVVKRIEWAFAVDGALWRVVSDIGKGDSWILGPAERLEGIGCLDLLDIQGAKDGESVWIAARVEATHVNYIRVKLPQVGDDWGSEDLLWSSGKIPGRNALFVNVSGEGGSQVLVRENFGEEQLILDLISSEVVVIGSHEAVFYCGPERFKIATHDSGRSVTLSLEEDGVFSNICTLQSRGPLEEWDHITLGSVPEAPGAPHVGSLGEHAYVMPDFWISLEGKTGGSVSGVLFEDQHSAQHVHFKRPVDEAGGDVEDH